MTRRGERGPHWEHVYTTRRDSELSWFQASADISLRLLTRFASPDGSVIDVGAGTSPLTGALLDAGWRDVSVLDISPAALAATRDRLGGRAALVDFIAADLLTWIPRRRYNAWHDRAVFHFLVDAADRQQYVRLATEAVAPGGVLVLGTFAADGPTECSGLPTARYDPQQLASVFAPAFSLEHSEREEHRKPGGTLQPFTWVVLRTSRA